MRLSVCLCLLCTGILPAEAADFEAPAWRGQPGTTFQQWEFSFEKPAGYRIAPECAEATMNQTPWGQQATPEVVVNSYQATTGICVEFKTLWFFSRRLDWLQTHHNREGVWQIENRRTFENFLNFIIPNADREDHTTLLKLQFVYNTLGGAPEVQVKYPVHDQSVDASLEPAVEYPPIHLPEGWVHQSMLFRAEGCPRYESVFLYPREQTELFVDAVTIDTLCTASPDEFLAD